MENLAMKIEPGESFRQPEQAKDYSTPNITKMFCTIDEEIKLSGLSGYYIRQGIKDGWIPHIRCGNKAMINHAKFIALLNNASEAK